MDKYPLIRKCLAVGIILLSGVTSIIPSSAQDTEKSSLPTSSGNWLYVGGSGPGNYTRIQDAIDNASDGDTVFVYNGVYSDYFDENYACVLIDKQIHLLGEDREQTIINGPGYQRVVFIRSNDVVVSGFTLQHGGTPEQYGSFGCGVFIFQQITNIHIYDVSIQENYYGVSVEFECSDVYIYDNIITRNYQGFENAPGNHNLEIFNNTISQNAEGLYVYSNDCHVHHNLVVNNAVGIQLYGGKSNVIIAQNHFQDNTIGIQPLITRATIQENNFINNEKHVDLYKAVTVLLLPFVVYFRQRWLNNFWDDWNSTLPRPIHGEWGLFIIIRYPKLNEIQIASFPYTEYDWHPAQEPYNISGIN